MNRFGLMLAIVIFASAGFWTAAGGDTSPNGFSVKQGPPAGPTQGELIEAAQQAIEQLRLTASSFEQLADKPLGKSLSAEEEGRLVDYDRWLRMQCARLWELAVSWDSQLQGAGGGIQKLEEVNAHFAQQKNQLISRMLTEQNRFEGSSPALKGKFEQARSLLDSLQ